MGIKLFRVSLLVLLVAMHNCSSTDVGQSRYKWPTVMIAVLVRNKAHTLPYFLSCLHELDYPKDRMYIWISTDHNQDGSVEILEKWVQTYQSAYHSVNVTKGMSSGPAYTDEKGPTDWSPLHFKNVIKLREEALHVARKSWADYLFMIDADAFITNPSTLKSLIQKDLDIVAPMLISDGLYSNFWCGMTENYYYKRTDDYKPILSRDKDHRGCFTVPMVHSAVLVKLKLVNSDHLTYDPSKIENYDGPEDDIIAFAINSARNGLTLKVCNDEIYGFIPIPLGDNDDLDMDYDQVLNIKLEAISKYHPVPLDPLLESYVEFPERWNFNIDEIFMINLERRAERRALMELSFKELGMEVKTYKAVDGRDLDINDLGKFGITLMPNYADPYHKRPMKTGEVGCFLSHYFIWKQAVERGVAKTLVLEDDIHFVPYFRHKLLLLLNDLEHMDWDLVYLGRKILLDADEVSTSNHTVKPLYSYWTLGYLVSLQGARKLMAAEPLTKMLPVDEFLPIMFDQHPNDTWKAHFPHRNLNAFSAAPLLVHPTHYTGQEGYISDTEDSHIVDSGTGKNQKQEL